VIDRRSDIGAAGERIAAAFLQRHGVTVERRNVRVGRGEVDLIGSCGSTRFVIEVRSRVSEWAPIEAFDHAKREQLWRLSREVEIGRVDLVAIGFGSRFIAVHWIPRAL
jgi:putative endonuclease